MGAAEADEQAGVAEESGVAPGEGPVEPVPFGVVAVSVVVAALGAAHFVAHVEHGNSLADEEQSQSILGATQAQGVDLGILGRTFGAAIPGQVVVTAVTVPLAILEVELFLVGKKIGQGETVVAGDEIDRGGRFASALLVKVG